MCLRWSKIIQNVLNEKSSRALPISAVLLKSVSCILWSRWINGILVAHGPLEDLNNDPRNLTPGARQHLARVGARLKKLLGPWQAAISTRSGRVGSIRWSRQSAPATARISDQLATRLAILLAVLQLAARDASRSYTSWWHWRPLCDTFLLSIILWAPFWFLLDAVVECAR